MAKYIQTTEVEAEQFLPDKDIIPKGVMSDGPRSPRIDPRASWGIKTEDGFVYLLPGDYVITAAGGMQYRVSAELFEKMYKPLEG